MAKSTKNWVRLSAAPQWNVGTTGEFKTIDLSAYVDPLRSKGFRIMTAGVQIMNDDTTYGLMSDSGTNTMSVGMQIVTGTQTAMTSPADGKVVYHNFGLYSNDADGGPFEWQQYEWKVEDFWPDGYFAVVDTLTCAVQSTANFSASDLRIIFTVAGYQVGVTSNQLASLLVAQTQS